MPHALPMKITLVRVCDNDKSRFGNRKNFVAARARDAIAKSLVERHGGSIVARSEGPGRGSQFEIRLPLARQEEEAAATGPASAAGVKGVPGREPGAARRILVVDDNEDGAEMLSEVLSAKGYRTRVARDAPSALEIAGEFRPEVAFLDIGLPVMDGYELARHLRARGGIRLVAVTGYGQRVRSRWSWV